MNWTNTIKVSLLSGILLGAATSQAQVFMPSMEEFGKNRIQRERFEWQVYTTPNFEVYFHGNSRSLATYTAQMAESEFDRITDILSYTPYSRTKIFLYDSPSDLKQSNIGISLNSETAIREENLSKSRVQIAFTADHIAFRQKLAKEVSSVFVYDMLYGGSLKDALQSQLLLSLPEWFISGITAYVAEGWSRELDDYMRDVALNKKFKKPAHLSGPEATRVGQSIWNFIAERYGRDNISNILNLTRIIRTEQTSISSTLGISYNRFLSDWRDYYTQMATSSAAAFKSPSGSTLASYPLFTGHKIEQVKLSPNRQWIAYSVMDNGQYHVYLTDTQGQQKTQLLKGGDRFLTRELPVSAPLLAWQANGTLNVLEQKDDRTLLHQFVESEKKGLRLKARRTVRGFTQIAGFDISQDGSVLAISGDRKGQNDLFLYNLSRNSVLQLTNDLYDDLTPAFVGRSTTRVLFASNRTNDTLSTAAPKILPSRFNLYLHDGNPRSQVLERLADQALQPMASNGERMFYLSDQQGIQNLFTYDTTSRQARPLSQFVESMTAYDYHPGSGALAYVSIENGRQAVKFLPRLAPVEASETTATGRSIRLNGGVARTNQPASGATDPTKAPVGVGTPSRLNSLRPGEIDTDNYQFDLEGLKVTERRTDKPSSSPRVITNSRSRTTVVRRDATRLKGPTAYKDVFVVNNTNNQFLVLPYLVNQSGFGWQNTITVNDLLENNIIKGGLFITPTFRTSEIFAEYQYLVHRIDFSARFDRRAFTDGFPASGLFTKYRYNRLTLTAAYPITEALRVSASPMYTRLNRVDGSQGGIGLPDAVSSFVGLQGEVVYDDTRSSGMNLLEGTRVKLRAQQQQGMRSNAESFFKITLDARNYTKVYRDLTLATRISLGHSGGKAPKQSILGGIDNWIPFGTVREVRNAENPLNPFNMDYRNVFFTDFVTPLRGFRMNKLSGESYALFNAELRWPVFKVLSRGPITSTFLQNFQLTAFTDIGTAWTGSGPFSRQNSLNTEIINPQGSPWYASVNNFKNPYLIGYGVGVRTLFLGYYVKGDLAWGIEDTAVQTPILHVSLGYDF